MVKTLFFCFSYFFAMETLNLDTIALIVTQPDYTSLNRDKFQENAHRKLNQKYCPYVFNIDFFKEFTIEKKIEILRHTLIPHFNFLFTCKRYYSDKFKNKVKQRLMICYIPQGICIYFVPQTTQEKILQNDTYVKIKQVFKQLLNLCIKQEPITFDSIKKVIDPDFPSNTLNQENDNLLKTDTKQKFKLNYNYSICFPCNFEFSCNNFLYTLNIKYSKNDNKFLTPYTLIEYLFAKIKKKSIKKSKNNTPITEEDLNAYEDTEEYKLNIHNLFVLIKYLYEQKEIDIELPMIKYSHSIENDILQFYYSCQDNEYLSLLIAKFSTGKPTKNIYERPCEESAVIGIVADLLLFPNKIQLDKKCQIEKEDNTIAQTPTELSHIKTQKNIRKSTIKIAFFLIFIISIMSHCYQNGYFKKVYNVY